MMNGTGRKQGVADTAMWGQLITDSLLRPRTAARQVLAVPMPGATLLQAAVVVACVGMVLGYAAYRLSPDAVDVVSAAVIGNPLVGMLAQLAVMAVIVFLTVRVGRLFGGTGGLAGALALVVWLNAMMVLIQAAQLVALLLLPPVAALLAVVTIFWALWAYANFVAELHGFQNPFMVLGAVVLTAIVLFFGAAMLFAILGITPQEVS
jgi:Yip1 domain